jgi:hypothetical protein
MSSSHDEMQIKVGSNVSSYLSESSYSIVASGIFSTKRKNQSNGQEIEVLTLLELRKHKTHLGGSGSTSKFRLSTLSGFVLTK